LSSGSVNTSNSTVSSTPTFGSFAKATSSPFAAAAAAGNALGSQETTSPISSTTTSVVEKETHSEENDNDSPTTFGEGAKVKVPGVKQTEGTYIHIGLIIQLTHAPVVKTGEEDEDTVYQTKGKLLVLDTRTGNWKERGVGTFRINMKEDAKKVLQTRLVMRTDSVYRVILNLLLFEGMKVFIMQDKFVRFAGFETETKEDGTVETKLISFALKLSNPNVAQEVCDRINEHIPLPASSSQ
jgi:Ran-binding protein 3